MTPLIIPIAFEWVILATSAAPLLLAGRFSKTPRLGLTIWFTALLSSGLAALLAIFIAVASIFETYLKLSSSPIGSADWVKALGISFAPWLILAISGIALAVVNQRLEPIVSSSREDLPNLDAALQPVMNFHGRQVMRIELPVKIAAAVRRKIVVSSSALESLSAIELEAVLWHEVGHLSGRHSELKQLAGLVRTLSPWLVASQALVLEVHRLCELDADRFASKRVSPELLTAVRAKFLSA